MRDPRVRSAGTRGALFLAGGQAMTATTKEVSGIQSNVHAVMVRLRPIEGLEGRTELTRVGPAWRRTMTEPDTEENDSAELESEDASSALEEFRAQHQRRRLGIVTFVLGCSIGILGAVAPHSRFFRTHVLHERAASVSIAPPLVAPVAVPAAAPAPPPEAQAGLAMTPLDIDALMPKADVVATPQISIVTSKHAHAPVSASHVASPPAPPPVAKASPSHAKSHATAPAQDEDAVKNARAADDLAAAQLSDSL